MLVLLALIYASTGTWAAWQVVRHSDASTQAIDAILKRHNVKNEGALALDRFTKQHPILGTLFGRPLKSSMKLPDKEAAAQAVRGEVRGLLRTVEKEATAAAWGSCFLLGLSAAYVGLAVGVERSFRARGVVFALTGVTFFCFFIGILAPAMIVWTAPTVPMEGSEVTFVLQHEVRGIAAIIHQLFTSGHWVIGGFLFLFSIATPFTKASLTIFVTASHAKARNHRIGRLLHSIGKWSMADVFVAGILLALYALKTHQATQAMACLGLFYFIGYCVLSLGTTELMMHSEMTDAEGRTRKERRLGGRALAGVAAGVVAAIAAACAYTYAQYPLDSKAKPAASTSLPQQLEDARPQPKGTGGKR